MPSGVVPLDGFPDRSSVTLRRPSKGCAKLLSLNLRQGEAPVGWAMRGRPFAPQPGPIGSIALAQRARQQILRRIPAHLADVLAHGRDELADLVRVHAELSE